MSDTDRSAPTNNQTAPPKRRRWGRWLIVASLALNLLLLGSIAGAMWRFGGPAGLLRASMPTNLVFYAQTLPSDRRRTLIGDRAALRKELGESFRELRDARNAVASAILTDPFDPAVYQRAQDALFETEYRLRLEQGRVVSRVLTQMTAEERRAYVKWNDRRRGKGWHRSHRDTE